MNFGSNFNMFGGSVKFAAAALFSENQTETCVFIATERIKNCNKSNPPCDMERFQKKMPVIKEENRKLLPLKSKTVDYFTI